MNTFLYCVGEEAESVLSSTNATEEDRKSFYSVLTKFDVYFQVRKNVIYERARFNKWNQQSGETAEQYIMALYELAAHCNSGDFKEEMIRDRLVVRIRDSALSEKLQLDSSLTLKSAEKAAHVHTKQTKIIDTDSNLERFGFVLTSSHSTRGFYVKFTHFRKWMRR